MQYIPHPHNNNYSKVQYMTYTCNHTLGLAPVSISSLDNMDNMSFSTHNLPSNSTAQRALITLQSAISPLHHIVLFTIVYHYCSYYTVTMDACLLAADHANTPTNMHVCLLFQKILKQFLTSLSYLISNRS